MTTDSGNDQTPNNAESEIVRTIGELPEEVLAALQQLPPEFINRLADLSPEAIEQLTRLPAAMLGGLSALPTPMLEWLGRASGRSDSSLSAGTLIRFASIAHLSSEPLRTLKAIPSEMLKVMAALPPDVFNSLMELPAALLKQLPDALAATSDTLDEIPTNLAELSADSEDSRDSSSNIAPELMATLSEMPDGAIQTIASLSPESIATISELDADILETIRQLPEELLEAISQVPSGALSTIFELPIDSATTLSELDPKLLEQLAADDTPSDTGEPAPKFPSMLLVKLGQAEDGSGRVLGRLLAEAQSYKELRSAPSSQHSVSNFDNAAATVSEIPENAFPLDERATMPEVSSSFTDADFDEEGDTDHGEFAASASGSAADDDNSDDPGATVQDIPTDIAAMAADTRPEDSFEEASIADAWAEGLSALDTGDQKPRDRDIIESGDFSQVINPEGISEDDDSNGGTVESDDWEPANAGDGSATQGRDDEDGSGDDSYGETVQSDDLSLEFGGGMQTFQDDASKTVPTTDGHAESEDDSYGATVQSDEGWSTEGLSALDQNAGSNESYSENGQRDASSNPGRTIQDASPDDDESFSQTVQSDDNWSADGSNSLNASESDDDSFGATVQSDEWSNAGSDDQSFSQTVNLNDSFAPSGDNDDDSFGATVQSGEHTQDESFSQTIASSDLTADERRTMADAWGTNLDDANVRPDMTIKSDNVKKASPNHTLVITQKQLGTGKILDYEKGHPFPEPKEPEYELLKKLGEGGMGLVFMARQRSIDREVALKMLKPKTAKDPEQRAKFLTEAVVTGDLDHPNIVPIYDVGSSPDNALFYAMKKVEGTPWLDVVLEKSLEENLDILMSTSDAVSFAHSRGVVHRDLKPENVMLGAFNEVLVMDWGLAYSTDGFRKSKSITESTSMGGTPAYMAPEMATGPIKKIGPRSDVYLLGAILFEIVTGKPPHAGKNAMKCLMSAARNQIRDSDNERTRRNDPTGELLKIAHKAMATKLEDRYQSVNEMQEAIRDYESHTESITLTLRALEELREAKAKQDYDLFSRARFGYEEALNLWGANTHAQNGLVDTKFAYAKCAQTKGDFDLGMSLLDTTVPEHKALNDELLDARNTVLAREQQLEEQKAARAKMRRIITVGTVAALIMMSGLAGWAFMEREEAVKQEQIAILNADEAKRQEDIAKESEKEALVQKGIAVENEQKAVIARNDAIEAQKQEAVQREVAVAAKDAAVKAQMDAEIAQKQEAEQRVLAVQAKDTAVKAQMAAEIAQKEEEKQRMLAVKARDSAIEAQKAEQVAREAEEYQAYIARIGLADAKIRENAFDAALAILNDCPSPLRNWEWGRLMHLCSQSIGTFNNEAPVDGIALAPDGKQFVTGGWNGSATIWNLESGKQFKQLKHDGLYVYSVDWSADGKWIATGSNDSINGYVQLWNAETGERVDRKFGDNHDESTSHTDAVLSVRFSKSDNAGGLKLLTSSYDNTARLWNVTTGKQDRRFLGHTWWVWDAQFSPDEKEIVTVSQDGTAIVWNVESGEPGAPFTGHHGAVYSAAFSPDNGSVVTGGYDKRVLVWRPEDVRAYEFRRLTDKSGSVIPPAKFLGLDAHAGPVRTVAFSQDGTRIISGSQDNTIRLWNAEGGQLLKSFRGHDGAVRTVAFAENDQVILSGSHDNSIRKWNIREYEEIRVLQGQILEGHLDAILSAEFSPDGERIVTASRDRTARSWEANTGQPLKVFAEGHSFLATSAVFFPGGQRLATGAVDNTVRLWDVDSGTQLRHLEHTGRAAALAASSDGKWLVTGSDDRTAKVWDVDSGELKFVLKGHQNEVTAVAISGDDRQILTGDSRGRVTLWDVQNKAALFQLEGHARSRVTAAAFLSGTNRVLTASADRTVAQWNVETGKEVPSLILKHPDSVVAMSVRPKTHQVLTACGDGSVRLWDADTAQVIGELERGDSKITDVAIDADGRRALAVDANGRRTLVFSLNVNAGRLIPEQTSIANGPLWSAIFAPLQNDLGILALGGSDAKLIGLKSPQRDRDETLVSFSPHGVIASASYSPDGSKIVTGSWDFSARIWDANSGTDLRKLSGDDGHTGFVNSAVFSPDAGGRWVLTGSDDGTAKIWDAATGAVLATLAGHEDRVRHATFSNDGKRVLTSSNDRTARIWNLSEAAQPDGSMKVQAAIAQVFQGHEWAVLSAEFSDDGLSVITASEDNTARIWNAQTGEQKSVLAGHTARVTSVAFAPGDQPDRAVTASQDGAVKLWDTRTTKEILTLDGHTREVTSVTFSPDGKYVLTASEDGRAILWLTVPWQTAPPKEELTGIVRFPVTVSAE